jgi:hypothetical protein
MLADQRNILAALTANSYKPSTIQTSPGGADNQTVMHNIDSEIFGVPFGLMFLMKTRGGGTDGSGKLLSCFYAEYCMFANYSFSVASSSPVITEGVSIECDRLLPVSIG